MNIFKKIGSFSSNFWKDVSEVYPQQQSCEEPEISDNNKSVSNSFELKKKVDIDVEKKKAVHGFFRKRFSKKKLLVDPRSPTTEFQRTPIQLDKEYNPSYAGKLELFLLVKWFYVMLCRNFISF